MKHTGAIRPRTRSSAAIAIPIAILVFCGAFISRQHGPLAADPDDVDATAQKALVAQLRAHIEKMDAVADKLAAPDFPAGKEWFNAPPLSFERELRGKVVVLDFWTYCCINCIHVLPDLAWLEAKYAAHPVAFVGVHSAKFANEKVSENIRQAVLRYEIAHPVINDDEMQMWRQIGVRSWPSLAVVGPKGNLLLMVSGEGQRDVIDAAIEATLEFYPGEIFRHDPVPHLAIEPTAHASPLRFPGKLAVDEKAGRLYISDSNHHRIVVCDLDGRFLDAIGTGRIGLVDGSYAEARFQRPQGVAIDGTTLWVADAENHALRRVDLERKTVETAAGDGKQSHDRRGGGVGSAQGLSTPWDVVARDNDVLIAMAGTHQIWSHDKKTRVSVAYSGNGREQNANSEDPLLAAWSQPSGLSIGDGRLFVADSESSTVRAIQLASGATSTLVGGDDDEPRDLFAFGDTDGVGDAARLQHPLGVLWLPSASRVLVADTYNHRLKIVDPAARSVSRWVGSGEPGLADGPALEARFAEPSGFALAEGRRRLYVADTNNHAIRIVDLETLEVRTLELEGVPPALPPRAPRTERIADLPGTPTVRAKPLVLAQGSAGKIALELRLPTGHHYTAGAGSRWQLLAEESATGVRVEERAASGSLETLEKGALEIPIHAEASGASTLRVEALAYYCRDDGPCRVGAVLFEIPVEVVDGPAAGDRATTVSLRHEFPDELPSFGSVPSTPAPEPAEKR